ncbi:MAG: DUF2203 family protein [Myxococcales bacterium]|nr:DUF2203 family protein [Myxococcales bacterium]USN51711.1 MAG: DUF2203 family protein [Myxococcales bacterium]
MILRTVTLQEANGLLPLVREHFLSIHILLSKIYDGPNHKIKTQHPIFDKKSDTLQLCDVSGHPQKKLSKKQKAQIHRRIEQEINAIFRLGAIVRSLFPPHIDFPSLENGHLVFLCWHGSDEQILHWHYPNENVGIRQSIMPDRLGPNMVH